MKKISFFVIFIIIIGALVFFFRPKRTEEKTMFAPEQKKTANVSGHSATVITTDRKPQTEEITYTDEGFNPTVLSIFSGDTVIFKNKSSKSFQPANDLRSGSTGYLGFGATTTISRKSQYQFTFTEKGVFGYYDSLNQNMFGAIVVR